MRWTAAWLLASAAMRSLPSRKFLCRSRIISPRISMMNMAHGCHRGARYASRHFEVRERVPTGGHYYGASFNIQRTTTRLSMSTQNSLKIVFLCPVLGPAYLALVRLNRQMNMNLPCFDCDQYCIALRGSGAP